MDKLSVTLHPLLTEGVLQALKKMSISSVLEFLEAKSEDIARHTDLSYAQIVPIRDCILSKYTEQVYTGLERLEKYKTNGVNVPCGITNLDRLLGGGFLFGAIYELCGMSSSGKSQICIATAANIISTNENVFYIDSKRDLSLERISSILSTKSQADLTSALKRLFISRPYTVYDLITLLHDYIDNQTQINAPMIIIDSLPALFFQHIADQTTSLSLLSNVKSLLNYIAVEKHTAILVTNVLTWQNDELDTKDNVQFQKAALGKLWSHAPTTRINTTRLTGSDILLTITKSSNIALGTATTLTITENGVS